MANRKVKPRSRDSTSTRAKSVELGEGDLATKRNPRTGRPIRQSAGRRESDSAYVNTVDAIDDDDDDPFFDGPEDEEGNVKKRKRTPSPPPPGLDNVAIDQFKRRRELDFARSPTPDPILESYHTTNADASDEQPESETINVTLNIPPGTSGPVHLSIDRNLLRTAKRQHQDPKQPRTNPRGKTTPTQVKPKSKDKGRAAKPEKENLILKLPPELRIKIMKNLFVVKDKTDLSDPCNFSRSSAFLRTCKKIHDEGCELLYGANQFVLSRNTDHRTPLWSSTKKEIGYHDVHLWLHTIGPINISRIRTIKIFLCDAYPSARGIDERRFFRDDHLIHSLRLLAQYGEFHHIDLRFMGRRPVPHTEFRFMDAIRRVKCDELKINSDHYSMQYTNEEVYDVLKRQMVRRVEDAED